jgi:hypothetical protein
MGNYLDAVWNRCAYFLGRNFFFGCSLIIWLLIVCMVFLFFFFFYKKSTWTVPCIPWHLWLDVGHPVWTVGRTRPPGR